MSAGQSRELVVYSVEDTGHSGHHGWPQVPQVSRQAPHLPAEESDAASSEDERHLAAALESVAHGQVGDDQVGGCRGGL